MFDSDTTGRDGTDNSHPFPAVLRRSQPDAWLRSDPAAPSDVLVLDGRTGRHPARTGWGRGGWGLRGSRHRTAPSREENRGGNR
ncbi:MAG: hypothetical protein GXX79_07475 [Actinomycetales bacterium]|nr:hypothetical protein [Actinomycetales bacterium]